jgi:hypothetical protein
LRFTLAETPVPGSLQGQIKGKSAIQNRRFGPTVRVGGAHAGFRVSGFVWVVRVGAMPYGIATIYGIATMALHIRITTYTARVDGYSRVRVYVQGLPYTVGLGCRPARLRGVCVGVGFGFRVSEFRVSGFRVSDFRVSGVRVSGFGFRASGFRVSEFRVSRFRVSGFRVSGVRVSGFG